MATSSERLTFQLLRLTPFAVTSGATVSTQKPISKLWEPSPFAALTTSAAFGSEVCPLSAFRY